MFRISLLLLCALTLAISGQTCGLAAIEEAIGNALDPKTVEATLVANVTDASGTPASNIRVTFDIFYPFTSVNGPDSSDSATESHTVVTNDRGDAAFTYTCPLKPNQGFWILASAQAPSDVGCSSRPNNSAYIHSTGAYFTYDEFSLSGSPASFRSEDAGTITLTYWYLDCSNVFPFVSEFWDFTVTYDDDGTTLNGTLQIWWDLDKKPRCGFGFVTGAGASWDSTGTWTLTGSTLKMVFPRPYFGDLIWTGTVSADRQMITGTSTGGAGPTHWSALARDENQ